MIFDSDGINYSKKNCLKLDLTYQFLITIESNRLLLYSVNNIYCFVLDIDLMWKITFLNKLYH